MNTTATTRTIVAVAEALREEYKAIVDAGFILQIDDAYIASYYDVMVPPGTMADFRKWARTAHRHPQSRAGGHSRRTHALSRVLGELERSAHDRRAVQGHRRSHARACASAATALELANPRHEHEWRVWEEVKLPPGCVLVPGVISHQTNVVEHPELVAERIERLAHLVGRDNVIASTDCGFAQGRLCDAR